MIDTALHLLIGFVGVVIFILAARRVEPSIELRWYAGGLVIAAGVYVAFGLILGGKPLGFEIVQLAAFTLVAVAGLRHSAVIVAAGWLVHAGWDALHTLPILAKHAPEWYVAACIAFDIALACYMILNRNRFAASTVLPVNASNLPQPE